MQMKVYHGSYKKIEHPAILASKYTKDFGRGFYCTILEEQAHRWSKRFESPVVTMYEYLPKADLDILDFDHMSEDWLDFIVSCRHGDTHAHDIVIGAMANDQVFNYIADLLSGILTREQFWILAKFKHPTHQIAFCTDKALQSLRYLGCEEVRR